MKNYHSVHPTTHAIRKDLLLKMGHPPACRPRKIVPVRNLSKGGGFVAWPEPAVSLQKTAV